MALQKVFNFSISHIFETRVAGRMVADMCRAAVKVSLGFLDWWINESVTNRFIWLIILYMLVILKIHCFSSKLQPLFASENSVGVYFVTAEWIFMAFQKLTYTNMFSVLPRGVFEVICSSLLQCYNSAYNE